MPNVSTANTVAVRTGTNWTINVTATNLDTDLSVKDFIVLHNNALVDNVNYTKTSATILTYTGAALPTDTQVEIRRKTPVEPVQEITFATRFSSALWNKELERTSRWKAETEVNGSGLSGIGIPTPSNEAYGINWAADSFLPPTRQAVYDKIQTMPTLASAPFAANPTVPDIVSRESTTKVPNTKYVDGFYASKDSPILTGNPSVPTRTQGDNTTGIASTAFVMGERCLYFTSIGNSTATVARGLANKAVLHTLPTVTIPAGYSIMFIAMGAATYPTANDTLQTSLYYGVDVSVNGGGYAGVASQGNVLVANYGDNYFPVNINAMLSVVPGSTYILRYYVSYLGGAASKTFANDASRFNLTLFRTGSNFS